MMRNPRLSALFVTLGLALGAAPLLAHHSLAAQFDESAPVTLTGVISKVEWINPHVYLHIDVADQSGKTSTWAVETFPPGTLRRGGLTRESIVRDAARAGRG
jgi:hypothetical protein